MQNVHDELAFIDHRYVIHEKAPQLRGLVLIFVLMTASRHMAFSVHLLGRRFLHFRS